MANADRSMFAVRVGWVLSRPWVIGLVAGMPPLIVTVVFMLLVEPDSRLENARVHSAWWTIATVASLLLLAGGAVVTGLRPGPARSALGRGTAIGVSALGLIWLSMYLVLAGGGGDYEQIMEFVAVLAAPLAVGAGAAVGAAIAAVTRIVGQAIRRERPAGSPTQHS